MKRNIIHIDEEKCNGCGQCATACAEGAIHMVNGKARLVSETYCDGLGACLGHCPLDAIRIEVREAEAFDEEKTAAHLARMKTAPQAKPAHFSPTPAGCPGSRARSLSPRPPAENTETPGAEPSQLGNWPVQLMLASPHAPYFKNADLLLTADCVPFALPDFHRRFLKQRPVVVGCPKLDDTSIYAEKLAELFAVAGLKSLTVIHMEVPCCSGLVSLARRALEQSGIQLPWEDVTIGIQGDILSRTPHASPA